MRRRAIGRQALSAGRLEPVMRWRWRSLVAGVVLAAGAGATVSACSDTRGQSHRGIVLVSFDAGLSKAASDQDTLERALRFLARKGVGTGAITVERREQPQLAQVLVELDEAGDPCRATRWRSELGPLPSAGSALVIVVGGTIRSTAPFARRAGLSCGDLAPSCAAPGRRAGAVILSDRRGVAGVDPAVVLVHEIGHTAGLAHADAPGPCGADLAGSDAAAPALNAMLADLHGAARVDPAMGPEVTLEDITLSRAQIDVIEAYLESTP